jgi:hypothetical protein
MFYTIIALTCSLLVVCTAEDTPFNFTAYKRTTSSIEITWKLPKDVSLVKASVYATRESSDVTVRGNEFTDEDEEGEQVTSYVVTDLLPNSLYEVCMEATILVNGKEESHTECEAMKTIPYIRADSVYVFFIVLAVLLFIVLVGAAFWFLAKKRMESEEGDAEGGECGEDQTTPILKSSQPPAYEANNRPRTGIDDEDIPYITPPLAQLEKDFNQPRA